MSQNVKQTRISMILIFGFLMMLSSITIKAQESIRIRKADGEVIAVITAEGELITRVKVTDVTDGPYTPVSGDLRFRHSSGKKLVFSDNEVHVENELIENAGCYTAQQKDLRIYTTEACANVTLTTTGDLHVKSAVNVNEDKRNQPTYIRTTTYKSESDQSPIITTSYFDGLGREIQAQLRQDIAKSLISGTYYDEIGRPVIQTKMASLTTACSFFQMKDMNLADETNSFFENDSAYRAMLYDENPLSRTKAIGMPGEEFCLSSGHISRIWNFGVPASNVGIEDYFDSECFIKADYLSNDHLKENGTIQTVLNSPVLNLNYKYYLTVIQDPNGNFIQKLIDVFGDVVKTWEYAENAPYSAHDHTKVVMERYIYDIESNLMMAIPPASNSEWNTDIAPTSYIYDTQGQVIEKQSPDKGNQGFEYNDDGRLFKIIKPDNNQLIFNYDFLGRLSSIWEYIYQDKSYERVVTIYDNITNVSDYLPNIPNLIDVLSELSNLRGELVAKIARISDEEYIIDLFSYTDDGKVSARYKYIKHISANGLHWQKIAYEYDFIGNLCIKSVYPNYCSSSPPDPIITQYEYDETNRLIRLKNGSGTKIAEYTYNDLSLLERKEYYNTKTSSSVPVQSINYEYNIRDWIKKIDAKDNSLATNFKEELLYTGLYNGNISSAEYTYNEIIESNPLNQILNMEYQYDGLNRLISVTAGVGNDIEYNEAFKYDNIGRIEQTRRGGNSLVGFNNNKYEYKEGSNWLKRVTTKHINEINYTYDLRGNMITDLSKEMEVTYDWRNMPDKFELRNSPSATEYKKVRMVYDAFGNRVLKLEDAVTIEGVTVATVTKAVAYIDNELEYTTYNTASTPFSLTTAYISSEMGLEAQIDVDPVIGTSNNYFILDHLGSTRMLVSEDGIVQNVNAYYAYGAEEVFYDGPLVLRKQFTGKEFDKDGSDEFGENGMDLYYFGKRYYDSEVYRWICADPYEQFTDPYAYTGNGYNPINGIDLNGEDYIIAIEKGNPNQSGTAHMTIFMQHREGGQLKWYRFDFGPGTGASTLQKLSGGTARTLVREIGDTDALNRYLRASEAGVTPIKEYLYFKNTEKGSEAQYKKAREIKEKSKIKEGQRKPEIEYKASPKNCGHRTITVAEADPNVKLPRMGPAGFNFKANQKYWRKLKKWNERRKKMRRFARQARKAVRKSGRRR